MKVVKEFRNDLLKRKELELVETCDCNPGFEKVKTDVADQFSVEPETIIIRKVCNSFGSKEFNIELFIYDSVEAQKKIEVRNRKKKGKK